MFFGLFLPCPYVCLSFSSPLLSLFSLSVRMSFSQSEISLCSDCVDQVTNNICLSLNPHSCLFFFLLCPYVFLSVCFSVPTPAYFFSFCVSVPSRAFFVLRASVSFFFFSFLFCPSISQFLPPASFFLCPYVCLCVSLSLSFSQSPLPTSLLVRCCIGGMVMVPIADGVCRSGRKGNKAAGCSLSLQPPPPPTPSSASPPTNLHHCMPTTCVHRRS